MISQLPEHPEFVYIHPQSNQPDTSENSLKSNVLAGLSLGVKDLFDIQDIPTAAGSPDWLATHPVPDVTAPSVSALLQHGASFIGKTLTDELAYSLNGINVHYGTPENPAAPGRLPGGSSSGSAVAVAKGSVDIGLGTDTGGSIRVPASYNGLWGLRPTHDAIKTSGVVPLAPRFDTIGWLTRDLQTLQKVANVLLPESARQEIVSSDINIVLCQVEGLSDWTKQLPHLTEKLSTKCKQLVNIELSREWLSEASLAFRVLQGRQIWRTHKTWIRQHNPTFAKDIQQRLVWCSELTDKDERIAECRARRFIYYWYTEVQQTAADIVVLPTTPGAAPNLNHKDLTAYRHLLMGLTAPAGLMGAPQVSMPLLMDCSDGTEAPWGLSLLTGPGFDQHLLSTASLFVSDEH